MFLHVFPAKEASNDYYFDFATSDLLAFCSKSFFLSCSEGVCAED